MNQVETSPAEKLICIVNYAVEEEKGKSQVSKVESFVKKVIDKVLRTFNNLDVFCEENEMQLKRNCLQVLLIYKFEFARYIFGVID